MADFATSGDVSARLGRALTVAEAAQVTAALASVAGLIREAVGKAAAWNPSPVPLLFKVLSIEKAIGIVTNPYNLAAESEQLGALQHSQTFPRALDIGVFLTDAEERRVRRAAGVSGSASTPMGSMVGELDPLVEQ